MLGTKYFERMVAIVCYKLDRVGRKTTDLCNGKVIFLNILTPPA